MNQILDDFSPAPFIRAIEANFIETWKHFGRINGELYQGNGIIRITSSIPHIPYNGILYTNWNLAGIDQAIEENIAYFRDRAKEMIWAITPSARPADISRHLVRHGLKMTYELVGMAADLTSVPHQAALPPDTVIREVDDSESLQRYVDLTVWKWQLPPDITALVLDFHQQWGIGKGKAGRRWLVWKQGVPVAKVFLSLAQGAAGIYGVATVPDARRQGIGSAVTAAALFAAREAGYRIGVLHSTEMGLSVYRHLGFREYCRIYIYTSA